MPSKSAAPAAATEATPGEYCCPITGVLMVDAVVDPEGNTYERAAITEWLERNPTSPVTRAPLRLDQLVPNRALQSAIDAFRARRTAAALAAGASTAHATNPAELAPASAAVAGAGVGAGAGGGTSTASALMAAVRSGIDMLTGRGGNNNDAPAPTAPARTAVPLTILAQPATGGGAHDIDVLFTAEPPKGTTRSPVDVCCVVDVSGSMCGAAKVEGVAADEAELSLLDVVKHAVRTIAHVLKPTDRLAVVAYSSTAHIAHELVAVTPAKVASVELALNKLKPGGQTNLWDGLVKGMDLLRVAAKPGRMAAVFLLTDGCPNVIPPRGHMAMLRRYRDQHSWLPAVSTFGFGYQLDSKLLKDLAVEGGGTYCFIPDAGFVGTAFVHATSNLLATAAHQVVLCVEPLAGATLVMEGKAEEWDSDDSDTSLVTRTTWGAVVRLDSLQFGQSRSHVMRLRLPGPPVAGTEYVSATLKYRPVGGVKEVAHTVMGPQHIAPSHEVTVQHARVQAVEALKSFVKHGQDVSAGKLRELHACLAPAVGLVRVAAEATKDARCKKLLKDLKGQVTIAMGSREYFKKWGYHYLPSLAQAHARQMCNNFKDPGVQHYGGALFRTLRDEADALFVKLPPPTPSRAKPRRASFGAPAGRGRGGGGGRGGGRRSSTAAAPRARVNMAVYHNARGGCWTGDSMVHMAAGGAKPAREVTAGDCVATPSGAGATVTCVMKTKYQKGGAEISTLPSGLRLTPWHPVRIGGAWQFPCLVPGSVTETCSDVDAVYSFLLDGEHVAIINGTEAICLAHGIEGDKVASHPYFGTPAVVRDLEGMRGWDEGLVELQTPCIVRDAATGLITGLTQH